MIRRIKEILLDSDLSLSAFILGWAMVMWGVVAVWIAPTDFFTFADTVKLGTTWFWFWNYVAVGAGFIYCACRRFPPLPSLLIGGYGTLVWTWIAAMRGFSNFTSGVTLNAVVIVMGCLMVQRSGRQ